MKRFTAILAALLLALSFVGLSTPAASAQGDGSAASITFVAEAGGEITVPENTASGPTTVTFDNQGQSPFIPVFARLNPDVTPDDIRQGFEEAQTEGVVPLVTLLGGPMTIPQATSQATYHLSPGTHIVSNFADQTPDFAFFEVTESDSDTAVSIEADQSIELHNFAFAAPIEVSAGEQTWHIENHGEQWHEMLLTPVDTSTSVGEFQDFLLQLINDPQSTNFMPHPGSWTPMASEEEAWMTLDLQPGTYALLCLLPDARADHDHIHLEMGMVQLVNVTE